MDSVSGRQPVQIVEIDQDFCLLTFGQSPCQAALGGLSQNKCYNTRATCGDPENYLVVDHSPDPLPGPQEMIAYDETTDTGFFGEVPSSALFTGDELASEIGLSYGISQYSSDPWLKFYVGHNAACNRNNGIPYILYVAKKPYRHTVNWDNISARNAVYNDGRTVSKGSHVYNVRLLTGAEADPTSAVDDSDDPVQGEGSEWNELIYRIHTDTPDRQNGSNWATYSDDDIVVASGDGRNNLCQETLSVNTSRRVTRGFSSLANFSWGFSSTTAAVSGWRPCLAINAITGGPLVLRFTKPQDSLPFEWRAIPSLESVSTIPTQINPGGGDRSRSPLGSRSRVQIELVDHPYSDALTDPYRAERLTGAASASGQAFDPGQRGTFWSKWLARNPFYTGRRLRVREGYVGQDLADMKTRTYLITEIGGPSADGKVTIRADDILSLANPDKAQAPVATEGELKWNISETASSLVLIRFRDSDQYLGPESTPEGYKTVRIGDELIRYTSASINGDGDEITLSGLTRGTDGTEAEEHDAEERVQICLRYTQVKVWKVVEDLLKTYAGVPDEFIPIADWEEEGGEWLDQFDVTTVIVEPEGVTDLLGEITEQCQFFLWWDERDQEIKLRAIKPPLESATEINDRQHIIAGSWSVTTDLSQRVSQVWVYYLQRDPTKDLDDPTNYQRLRVRVDTNAESADEYDERRVKRIYSRWLSTAGQAINVSTRLLGRYRNGAKYIRFRLDAKDRGLWTADLCNVSLWAKTDAVGLPEKNLYQIISAEEVRPGDVIEYNLLNYDFLAERNLFWQDQNQVTYPNANVEETPRGGWWAGSDGFMSDGEFGFSWQ